MSRASAAQAWRAAGAALLAVLALAGGLARAASGPIADAPAIWRVEGLRAPFYLFGSMHLLPAGVSWRSPAVERALEESQVVVFETDVDGLSDPGRVGAVVREHGLLAQGRALNEVIPEETRRAFEAVAVDLGLPPSGFAAMRPWLAAVTLSMRFMLRQGSDPSLGVDQQINAWARANGRVRASLEPMESQVRLFSELAPREEAEFLAVTLRQIRETPQILDRLLAAYRRGDVEALERTVNLGLEEFPALRRRMLADRHERWLPQLEAMLADGRAHLVVVGAAHLSGPDSVVEMLRARGLSVERVH